MALDAAKALDYPKEKVEILVTRGRQPAVQRNHALRAARGDLVYFLDDDALPQPANLKRSLEYFKQPATQMVGGPNICPPEAPLLERVFAVCLASALAFGPSRARYTSVGQPRATTEKELILCNLMARREEVLKLGGFDESLYPNEENALMDALQQHGGKLMYDPEFIALRRPRPTLKAFLRMLFNYGRGRAEQFRLHPTPGSILNFVPPLFCLYLAALLALAISAPAWLPWAALPLGLYGLALLGQTVVSAKSMGSGRSLLAIPFLVATHVFYGFGFWRGLFTGLKPATVENIGPVEVERVQ